MTPAAIIAAAIEVLEQQADRPGPLDSILGRYQRSRRYIGAKDRSALAERLYGATRRQARLDWRLATAGATAMPRARIVADLILADGLSLAAVAELFDGGRYAPPPLSAEELGWAAQLDGTALETSDMPERVRLECPEWAWPGMVAAFGDDVATELRALQEPAPLDLRVNRLMQSRSRALADIRAAGFQAKPAPYAPIGVRLEGRVALGRLPGLAEGALEPQDEGSQLLALALGAQAGETIVDFCAGAGGKTLALAAEMANQGQIYALDIDGRRLERAAPRLAKAHVGNVRSRALKGPGDAWLKRQAGRFDRVLIDAPCSGVGAWRRNPDARWSRGQPPLETLLPLQADILRRAAKLVRPGGLLVYGTCSLLPDENVRQIERFLAETPDFRLDPPAEFPAPLTGDFLELTPARNGTDGFFAAWLRRADAEGD